MKNIMGLNPIQAYIKNINLRIKWQEENKNLLKNEDKYKGLDPISKSIWQWSDEQMKSQRLSGIHNALMTGKTLSDQDMQYLRENNPELYYEALNVKRERENYRRSLSKAKSKEEVKKIRQQKIFQFVTDSNMTTNSANMPDAHKAAHMEKIQMRSSAISNEHDEFEKTVEYNILPKTVERKKKTIYLDLKKIDEQKRLKKENDKKRQKDNIAKLSAEEKYKMMGEKKKLLDNIDNSVDNKVIYKNKETGKKEEKPINKKIGEYIASGGVVHENENKKRKKKLSNYA